MRLVAESLLASCCGMRVVPSITDSFAERRDFIFQFGPLDLPPLTGTSF